PSEQAPRRAVPDVPAVLAVVPDLSHATLERAELLLRRHDLSLGNLRRIASDQPTGTVVSQNPAPGTRVKRDTHVDVTLATTTPPLVIVPDLTRATLEQATMMLQRRDLALGERNTTIADQPPGTVVSQNPGPGTRVKRDTRVDVTLATTPPALVI